MKLKVQHVRDATLVLANIINTSRAMPQKGKYRVARMHAKLLPEFNVINARYDEMIRAYNTPQMRTEINSATGVPEEIPTGEWRVPPDKMPEFAEAWKQIGDEEIDVDVQPIPLSQLSLSDDVNGAIEAHELIALGELVSE